MAEKIPKPAGGRRAMRPQTVENCRQCGEALGGGYNSCPTCRNAVERIWLADWQALLAEEGIQAGTEAEKTLARAVLAEADQHAWTVVDIAMSLQECSQCGRELGEGFHQCGECGMAFGASILSEFGATPNEHALHIGRWVLRFPHHNSANIITAWRLSMPRLLTGWLPSTGEAQDIMDRIKAGRMDDVKREIVKLDRRINQAVSRAKKGSGDGHSQAK